MTDYEIKLPGELLSSLMSENTGFAQLLGSVLNQVLDARRRNRLARIAMNATQTGEAIGTA